MSRTLSPNHLNGSAPDAPGQPVRTGSTLSPDRYRLAEADLKEMEEHFHGRYQLYLRLRDKHGVPAKKGTWSENARTVIAKRIVVKDKDGEPAETPEEMAWRVALAVACAEADFLHGVADSVVEKRVVDAAHQFYDLMVEQRAFPNSPTLTNAGKPDLLSLAACFVLPVEDSLDKIFDTVKNTALIHKSGGGCVDGRAKVFTTFCGVEDFAVLYQRLRATGREPIPQGNGKAMDVRDLDIRTLSQNPDTGRFEMGRISHVWSFDVTRDEQREVVTEHGSVITSGWHPFMVLAGGRLVEHRADELQPGQILLRANRSVQESWPITEEKDVAGRRLTPDLAWLLAYFQGNGSLGLDKVGNPNTKRYGEKTLRLRFFDGRLDNLGRVSRILDENFGARCKIQTDARGLRSVATTAAEPTIWIQEALGVKPGPKHDLQVPDYIFKSPLPVIKAYLAGLIDSDGTVDSRGRVSVTMAEEVLTRGVFHLADLLGLEPAWRERAPHGKGKVPVFQVTLSSLDKIASLRDFLIRELTDGVKRERLAQVDASRDFSTYTRIPLPFAELSGLLEQAGVPVVSTAIHRKAVTVGGEQFWLANFKEGRGISRLTLRRLVGALRRVLGDSPTLDLLESTADNATAVTEVRIPEEKADLYDFTVEGQSTYLASGGEFISIHNTGFNFSYLRPKGARVGSTGGVSSGPVSFMRVIGAATESVVQGGTRRGANMGMLQIDHPDILEFIESKSQQNRTLALTNFNISVLITHDFMEKLKTGEDYDLIHPQTGTNLDPQGRPVGRLNSREVWDKIIQAAWATGDPGVVFVDRLEEHNPTPHIGKLNCTNPCGEQPLLSFEACNLGSINVAKYVVPGPDGKKTFDLKQLAADSKVMVRFLDNVIQSSWYALPEIFDLVHGNRKIGVGVMGYGDALIDMEIPYDSDEAMTQAEELMKTIHLATVDATRDLAKERGAFPNFKGSVYDQKGEPPRRNALTTTIAPTGTIGLLADAVCAGVEPLFAVAYMRTTADGMRLPYVHPHFEAVARQEGWYSPELMEKIATLGHVRGLPEVPEKWQKVFVTAHDVAPEWHVRTQATFQKWTDNAVSKTVNFSNDALPADVERVYMLAYEQNCKGVTIFRDGSLDTQVLTVGTKASGGAAAPAAIPTAGNGLQILPGSITRKMEVPNERAGFTKTLQTPFGKMHVTINEIAKGLPIEVFTTIGKAGSDITADAEAIGRLISLSLQLGGHVSLITHTLRGIGGSSTVGFGPNRVASMPDAIAKFLEEKYLEEEDYGTGISLGICPDCGKAAVVPEAGCATCKECGWKAC